MAHGWEVGLEQGGGASRGFWEQTLARWNSYIGSGIKIHESLLLQETSQIKAARFNNLSSSANTTATKAQPLSLITSPTQREKEKKRDSSYATQVWHVSRRSIQCPNSFGEQKKISSVSQFSHSVVSNSS